MEFLNQKLLKIKKRNSQEAKEVRPNDYREKKIKIENILNKMKDIDAQESKRKSKTPDNSTQSFGIRPLPTVPEHQVPTTFENPESNEKSKYKNTKSP